MKILSGTGKGHVTGVGNITTNALIIDAVLVLCRLERGYGPMLDYDGRKATV